MAVPCLPPCSQTRRASSKAPWNGTHPRRWKNPPEPPKPSASNVTKPTPPERARPRLALERAQHASRACIYILPSLARITCALPSSFARANRPRGRLESIHQSSSPHSINSRNDQSERSSSPAASTARRAALRPAHTRAHEPWLRYDYFASFDSLARARARPSRRRPRRAGVGGRPRSRRRVARVRIARIRGRFVAHRARDGVGSKVRRGCWEGVRRRVVACACDWWRWEERAYRVRSCVLMTDVAFVVLMSCDLEGRG